MKEILKTTAIGYLTLAAPVATLLLVAIYPALCITTAVVTYFAWCIYSIRRTLSKA